MQYLYLFYSIAVPLCVLGLLVAHHQEVTVSICDNWYVLCVNGWINTLIVYRQHNYILQPCSFCYMFRPITMAIFRLLREDGYYYIQTLQCYDYYNYYTVCPMRRELLLHAYCYYVDSNISLHPVYMLNCVRVVVLPFGSGVVTPLFACVLLRFCTVFWVVRGVMVSRCWVLWPPKKGHSSRDTQKLLHNSTYIQNANLYSNQHNNSVHAIWDLVRHTV
jgi:hypothetical protein